MKRYFILLFLGFLSLSLLAQKPKVKNDPTHDDRPLHFGFSLGVNTMDYLINQSQYAQDNKIFVDVKELSPGINIHAIANLRLSENFDLRLLPGISFGERYINFYNFEKDSLAYDKGTSYKSESSYLELPLLLKYKSQRLNNFRPYLIGGANLRYDLATKNEYDYSDQLLMIKPLDVYGEFGFGMDFYLTYFKLGVEIKYSIGLTNILNRTNSDGIIPEEVAEYTDYIDRLSAQMFIISFHFE